MFTWSPGAGNRITKKTGTECTGWLPPSPMHCRPRQSATARVTRHGGGETQGHAQQRAGALRHGHGPTYSHAMPPNYLSPERAQYRDIAL